MGKSLNNNKNNSIIALLFVSILFTYNRSDVFFYINWLIGLLLIAFGFIYILKSKNINKKIIKSWLLVTAWLIPAILFTPTVLDKDTHITYILLVIFYTTVCSMFVYTMTKTKEDFLDIFYKINTMWIPVNLLYLIVYFINQENMITSPFSGIAANRNAFALVTTFLVSVLIYFYPKYSAEKIRKVRVLILLSVILIFATLSLKGIIGVFIILTLTYLSRERSMKKITILTLLIIISMVTLTTDNQVSNRIDRFRMTLNQSNELAISESAYERRWLIEESLLIINEKPLTGIGVNNSIHYLITPYHQLRASKGEKLSGTYSHNNYTEMLLNGGIPVLLLYYLPLIVVLFKLLNNLKSNRISFYLFIMTLYVLILHVGQVAYFDFVNIFIFILIIYSHKGFRDERQVNY